MTGSLQDIRYALRQIAKRPGFAATSIVVLAVGLAATTAMLAVMQSVLWRPLSYRHSEKLMRLGLSGEFPDSQARYPEFQELKRSSRNFEDLALYSTFPMAVETSDGNKMVIGVSASSSIFDLLGVRPEKGRTFLHDEAETGASPAIVSHEFWLQSMHGRADVLGADLKINSELYTVVGVMPPHFQFPLQINEIWTPLRLNKDFQTKEGFDQFDLIARLKGGVTIAQARAEGETFVRNLPPNSEDKAPRHFWVVPYQSTVMSNQRPALVALSAASLLLLLIAIVNIANLQIARVTRREGELATRAALGATRTRILRQLIIESLVLSVGGAVLGWSLSIALVKLIFRLCQGYPRFDELRPDVWTFVGCLILASFSGVLAAISPAWYALNSPRRLTLRKNAMGHGISQQRITRILVTVEVALTCVLLVGAGLFLRTFQLMQNERLGFEPAHAIGFVAWTQARDVGASRDAYARVLSRFQSMPGVEAAGLVTSFPYSNFNLDTTSTFSIPGHPGGDPNDKPVVWIEAGSSGLLKSLRIPLVQGRDLLDSDAPGSPLVGVVNQSFVNEFLSGVNPVGQQIQFDKKDAQVGPPVTIIGVVGDVGSGLSGVAPRLTLPFRQLTATHGISRMLIGISAFLTVRTKGNFKLSADDVRAVLKTEAPELAVDDLGPLEEKVERRLETKALVLEITAGFGCVALVLSAAGLYGVLAYLVGLRVKEIGIRVALGATRGDIVAMIARQGLLMAGIGSLVGFISAWVAGRWIRSFLVGVTERDWLTYLLAAAVVLLASASATFLPARRASQIEPMDALRAE